jgi:hypothetical protein
MAEDLGLAGATRNLAWRTAREHLAQGGEIVLRNLVEAVRAHTQYFFLLWKIILSNQNLESR